MRRILGCAFVSLDGVIQAPGGPTEDPTGGFQHGGWLPQFFDEGVGEAIDGFFKQPYDLLLGRRTYDIFAAYWPYIGQEPLGKGEVFDMLGKTGEERGMIAMGEAFTKATKYVLTRSNPELGWSNSQRVGSMEELAEIKRGEGPDMLIQGSGTLYPQLLAAGLIDRLTLMTFPALIGEGKRIFGDGTPAKAMKLVEQKVTSAGAVIATYEPAGEIQQLWAGPQIVSPREGARQQAMQEGRW